MKLCRFDTRFGPVALLFRRSGVTRIFLPPVSMHELPEDTEEVDPAGVPAAQAVIRYLAGEREPLAFTLDFAGVTSFRRRVYKQARRTGYGERCTYGKLAAAIGSPGAARAVGTAMAANPLPLAVPCHRVVAASGRLGGFSGPGGTKQKEALLAMEQAAFYTIGPSR